MKTLYFSLMLVLSALTNVEAQTNMPSPNMLSDLENLAKDVTGGTNWTVAAGYGLSTSGKNQVAYGVVAYQWDGPVGIIAGEDVLFSKGGHQWNSLKGGITLKTTIQPLKFTGISWLENINGTPFVADLLASGNGGSSVGNIIATGMDFNVYAFKNFELSAGAEYDNRTGQGIYSGNYITAHLAISRKF